MVKVKCKSMLVSLLVCLLMFSGCKSQSTHGSHRERMDNLGKPHVKKEKEMDAGEILTCCVAYVLLIGGLFLGGASGSGNSHTVQF